MDLNESYVRERFPEATAYKKDLGFWDCPHVCNVPKNSGKVRWTLGWGKTIEAAWAHAALKLRQPKSK